ncbi:MAG TPA: pyridoxamine 5'-phosphate oxidase family protein [Acidimicrobiia bacterium]|nr:pyridoxamine 5'-phosphate oxidase family protein [Acidimicrobiia bacterium]
MSVRLTPDEAWRVLERAHTGILTTLRRDGMPVTLPMWFVALDRTICFSTPSRTKKLARVRRDARASFLVESGERWAELEAVQLNGRVEVVGDEALQACIAEALDTKYAAFRTAPSAMSRATRDHYEGRTYLRLVPDERFLSWDNRKLGLA